MHETNSIRLSKIFHFEAAHALYGYDGKCKNIHGHSYKLIVTVSGIPIADPNSPKNGMVMDFKDLKRIVHAQIIDLYDHALILNVREGKKLFDTIQNRYERIIILPFQPSCEMLLLHFAGLIRKQLPEDIQLVKLKLYETESSFAEWYAQDNNA